MSPCLSFSLSRPRSSDQCYAVLPLLPAPCLPGCPTVEGSRPQRTRLCQSQAMPPTSTRTPPTSRLARPSHHSGTPQLAPTPSPSHHPPPPGGPPRRSHHSATCQLAPSP